MKKIILSALFLVLFASSAMAFQFTAGTAIGSLTFSTSNKVFVAGKSATTGYVIQGLHTSGSRVFTTDSAASKIYWSDAAITVDTNGVPTAGFASTFTAPTGSGLHGAPNPTGTGFAAL